MPDLKKPNVPAKMTWSEATYKQTLRLGQMMEPLKLLAEQSQDTHQPGPVSALIEAARLSGETDHLMIEKLDKIIQLLAAPSIQNALQDMMKG
jgi:hypothetical protein